MPEPIVICSLLQGAARQTRQANAIWQEETHCGSRISWAHPKLCQIPLTKSSKCGQSQSRECVLVYFKQPFSFLLHHSTFPTNHQRLSSAIYLRFSQVNRCQQSIQSSLSSLDLWVELTGVLYQWPNDLVLSSQSRLTLEESRRIYRSKVLHGHQTITVRTEGPWNPLTRGSMGCKTKAKNI